MRIIAIESVKPESVLARPLYDPGMRLLVNKGVILNAPLIRKLKERGYRYIYIQEEGTESIEVEDLISIDTGQKVLDDVETTFTRIRELTGYEKATIKVISDRIEFQSKFLHLQAKGSFQKNVAKLVGELLQKTRPVIGSFALSMLGTNPLSHAMDVAVLSILIGQRFQYEVNELVRLAKAALLHDCGMQSTPEILNKPYFLLTDEELAQYKEHPREGFNMLDGFQAFTPMETQAVLQHHENQNGTGFPLNHLGDNLAPKAGQRQERGKIFRWAEIIAVADRYVRYASGDLTELPLTPQETLTTLIKESGTILNSKIVKEFGNILNVYPKGAVVKILDSYEPSIIGYEGVVSQVNSTALDRPQVILLRSAQGNKIKPSLVNLKDDKHARLELLFSR